MSTEKKEDLQSYTCFYCGEVFFASKSPEFCIKCGKNLKILSISKESPQLSSESLSSPPLVPEIIYCPQCHTPHRYITNPRFCTGCRFEFKRDQQDQLIISKENYSVAPLGLTSQPLEVGPASNRNLPPNVYPMPYPPQYHYKIKKPKTWSVQAGIFMPIGVVILMFIVTLILALFTIDFSSPEISLIFSGFQTFLLGSTSLFFFVLPVLWIKRYYPNQSLTFKQRLSELGLPLNKYKPIELIREILLGAVFGVGSVLLIIFLTSLSQILTKAIFGIDPTLLSSDLLDQFQVSTENTFWDVFWTVALVIIFVGVPEEIMFRGFVHRSFVSKLAKSAAVLLTATFFALFHIIMYLLISPILFFFLFLPYLAVSLVLGILRVWRDDIIAAIVMHIIYDITQIIIVYIIVS